MKNWRTILSLLVLLLCFGGAVYAVRSSLFIVTQIEVDTPNEKRVSSRSIQVLAGIPLGQVRLWDLDLDAVRTNLLRNAWIESVSLQKIYPSTLRIGVELKRPKALVEVEKGKLSYVTQDGIPSMKADFDEGADLPLLLGSFWTKHSRISDGLRILEAWDELGVQDFSELSALSFEDGRGIVALATYYLGKGEPVRTYVELGQDFDGIDENALRHIKRVFQYLVDHSQTAKRISLSDQQKIVVTPGSGS